MARTFAPGWPILHCVVRASPAVWQIELLYLIFGKNVKNTPPTVWQNTLQFLAIWEKPASSAVGIVVSSQVGE